VTAPKRKQRKARKRPVVPRATLPNENGGQLSVSSKPAIPRPVAELIHETQLTPQNASMPHSAPVPKGDAQPAWDPPSPLCDLRPPGSPHCLRCKGIAELERARKARSQTKAKPPADAVPNFPLCSRCWSLGYAACGPCGAAHNPALRDWDGAYTEHSFPRLR